MKKIVSIILAAVLVSTLCVNSVTAAAFKQTVDPGDTVIEENIQYDKVVGETYLVPYSTSKAIFHRISLSDIAGALLSDPDASNVQFSGNTLTYMLPDGTISKIVQTIDTTGTLTFDITEGNKTDILTFDYSNNEVFLNGVSLLITKTEAYVYQDLSNVSNVAGENATLATTSSTTWVQTGNTVYYDCYVENQVRNATTSILLTLITALVNPLAAVTIGICSTIIQYFVSLQSTSKYFYISYSLYYDNDLPYYHYLEKINYYKNSNYTGLVTSSSNEILV